MVMEIDLSKTAIIVCDVWNIHWCGSASNRLDKLAPKINNFLIKMRKKGVPIVHCPARTREYYKDSPNYLEKSEGEEDGLGIGRVEGEFPIDDSDGGCVCNPPCKKSRPWAKIHPSIELFEQDLISESGIAVSNFLREQGIKNILYVGVHTNMCVLSRPYGVRRMIDQGFNCFVIGDLTDHIYNPKKWPYVSHEKSLNLVLEHIQNIWCPVLMSSYLLK